MKYRLIDDGVHRMAIETKPTEMSRNIMALTVEHLFNDSQHEDVQAAREATGITEMGAHSIEEKPEWGLQFYSDVLQLLQRANP